MVEVQGQIYSFKSKKWTTKRDMNQKRFDHSCAQVWLNPEPDPALNGIIPPTVTNSSVLSIVVAGGKLVLVLKVKLHYFPHRNVQK